MFYSFLPKWYSEYQGYWRIVRERILPSVCVTKHMVISLLSLLFSTYILCKFSRGLKHMAPQQARFWFYEPGQEGRLCQPWASYRIPQDSVFFLCDRKRGRAGERKEENLLPFFWKILLYLREPLPESGNDFQFRVLLFVPQLGLSYFPVTTQHMGNVNQGNLYFYPTAGRSD